MISVLVALMLAADGGDGKYAEATGTKVPAIDCWRITGGITDDGMNMYCIYSSNLFVNAFGKKLQIACFEKWQVFNKFIKDNKLYICTVPTS